MIDEKINGWKMRKTKNNHYNVGAYCNTPLQMVILAIVLMLILPSCGGAGAGGGGSTGASPGGGGASVSGAGGNGNLYMRIAWPDAPRGNAPRGSASSESGKYIPSTATKITIDISGEGLTSTEHYEYARPESGQTTVNITLPAGSKTAEIRAVDSVGSTLSYTQSSFTVNAGQTASISANLGVGISDSGFTPASITVTKGTTLMFVNNGTIQHTVTDVSGTFNSGAILPGASWSNTFNTAGTFNYRDSYNPALTGTITVNDSNAPPSPPSNLTATAVSSSRIDLAWVDNSDNETGFKIERKTGAGGAYAQIAIVGAGVTSYNNTDLTASTTYYYRVRAYNAVSDSDYSNEANTATSGRFAYVANNDSNNVSVVNTATNTVVATIAVGTDPEHIAITPNGRYVYVTNYTSDNVSVIDTSTNTVIATVAVSEPKGVAVTVDGSFAYAASYNAAGTISQINTTTNTVTAATAGTSWATQIAMTPNGSFAYVSEGGAPHGAEVLNLATNTVTAYTGGGNFPDGIAVTPNGNFVYMVNNAIGTVSVISTATNTVVTAIDVGGADAPREVAITPNGNFAYVTEWNTDKVSVINTATNTVATTVGVGGRPWGIAITSDGAFAYVANGLNTSNSVSVIDLATNTVTATISIGAGTKPIDVAITP